MIKAILGRKLGMTRIFNENNEVIPVTVISVDNCKVAQVKTFESDKYQAVQLCFGYKKIRNTPKPLLGHLIKHNINFSPEIIKEIKVDNTQDIKPGDEIKISMFSINELVDVQGLTKGKGFSGVVKRWGFSGGPTTHGQSDRQRAPGSIGSQQPQRVPKGRKMPGHLGNELVTIKNLQIVKIDNEKNLLFIKGCVPGNKNSIVLIKKTGKILQPKKQQVIQSDKQKKK